MVTKEKLKEAICNNDVYFFERNKNHYDINERFEDENNDTLLLYSISDEGSNLYSYFIQNSADINLTNDEGENILHAIVFSGDIKRLHDIIEKHDIDINHRSVDGATPLLLAISLDKTNIAEALITYGADVNIADINGIAPLHLASQMDDLNLLHCLLNKGADVFLKTKNGNLALALAVNAEQIDIVKILFEMMY